MAESWKVAAHVHRGGTLGDFRDSQAKLLSPNSVPAAAAPPSPPTASLQQPLYVFHNTSLETGVGSRLVTNCLGEGFTPEKNAVAAALQQAIADAARFQLPTDQVISIPQSLIAAYRLVLMTDPNVVVNALHGAIVSAGKEKNAATASNRDVVIRAVLDKLGAKIFEEADLYGAPVGLRDLIKTIGFYTNVLPHTAGKLHTLAFGVKAKTRTFDPKHWDRALKKLTEKLAPPSEPTTPRITRSATPAAAPRPVA